MSLETMQAAPSDGGASSGGGAKAPKKNGSANNGALDQHKTAAAASAAKPTVSHCLGELTWLLSQSPTHKHFAIADLEWMVMPAILLEQFRVFHGEKQPLGFALWAQFSEEAEAKFKAQIDAANSQGPAFAGRGARLAPTDSKSGDRLWLIELVAPFATPDNKLQEAMLADLKQNVFKSRSFKLHVIDPSTGDREEKEVG